VKTQRKKRDSIRFAEKTAAARRMHSRHLAIQIGTGFLGAAALITAAAIVMHFAEMVRAESSYSRAREGTFEKTIPNIGPSPTGLPAGMVWIPRGEFSIGVADARSGDTVGVVAATDSRPIHRVYVDGFLMDKTDVTNADFARFVSSTALCDGRGAHSNRRGVPWCSTGKPGRWWSSVHATRPSSGAR
jgi:formylglycine-generating enzyme required for sulfatase activity